MPSLKDLKNRIDSVKSTRKITKAMQMVAAAKLRRAQEQAENARPYAERMRAVLGNLAASVQGSPTAPKLLAGTGRDEVHLIVVATSERGLAGGFNSQIVKIARYQAEKLLGEGKEVKFLTVGKKGREMLRRDHGKRMVDHVDLSEVKRVGYEHAAMIAKKIIDMYNDRRVRRLHPLLFALPVGHLPDSDGPAPDPGRVRGAGGREGPGCQLRVRA
jgi:F-type H+-transporting ATPase subunit gamma